MPRLRTSRLVLGAQVAGLALFSMAAHAQPPTMRVHCINVGQGAATLLEFPCGAMLVDAGGQDAASDARLQAYLDVFFARRTDLRKTFKSVILTHSHVDHTRMLRKVVERYKVLRYVDSGLRTGSGKPQAQWVACNLRTGGRNIRLREVRHDEVRALPSPTGLTDRDIDPVRCSTCDPRVWILQSAVSINPGWSQRDFKDPNNHSLVVRVDFGDSSFLVTGDAETPALKRLTTFYASTQMLDIDAYQVGHHGAKNGTWQLLLDQMSPDAAVIAVGAWDYGKTPRRLHSTFAYGHPNKGTLDMIAAAIPGMRTAALGVMAGLTVHTFVPYTVSKAIYSTAWDGNLILECGLDGTIRVERNAP